MIWQSIDRPMVHTSAESAVQGEPFTETDAAITEAETRADCPPPESTDDVLTREIQVELRMRCGRQCGRVIDRLRVHVAGDAALIICATLADLDIVQREQIGTLQHILARLGVPPQLAFTTRAGWDARRGGPETGVAVLMRAVVRHPRRKCLIRPTRCDAREWDLWQICRLQLADQLINMVVDQVLLTGHIREVAERQRVDHT